MVCIEILDTGDCIRIENEIWITQNRNGLIRTPHRIKAKGVSDGAQIWSLGELKGYPQAKIITLAEFLATLGEMDEDPELSAMEALDIILGGSV